MKRSPRPNSGFALIVALWAMIAASTLAMTSADLARDALGTARNRGNSARAYWIAFGCLERARHAMYEILWPDGATPDITARAWAYLDRYALPRLPVADCRISIAPSGLTANVNALSASQLKRLLLAMRVDGERADSLIDALLDWRDEDDSARPFGAEREWYRSARRPLPRDGPISHVAELRFIRGFGELAMLDSILGVEPERVLWTRAPRAVLATLPGMTDEALNVLEARGPIQISDLPRIADFPEMSHSGRDTLARSAALLVQGTTAVAEGWTIRAAAKAGSPPITVETEIRVVLGDRRLVTVRRITRP